MIGYKRVNASADNFVSSQVWWLGGIHHGCIVTVSVVCSSGQHQCTAVGRTNAPLRYETQILLILPTLAGLYRVLQ